MTSSMRWKAENGVHNFNSDQEAHSAIKQTCTVYIKAEGKRKKCLKGFFLSPLKCSGKSWDKPPPKTVEAPILKFGELLWGGCGHISLHREKQARLPKDLSWETQ